ncbi:Glutathione S-transferase theta-3 [Durusdinium trenchii]|uniref:Glutathione S-transferase theta-3 n=1 Tax=Durusdinium trenchii TaxID=1381693 RepID=A0ABP0LL59_9DINO
MVMEYKELEATYLDGLRRENHDRLKAVNGRVEAPALVDGDLVVVNSADIVAYLDHRYPAKSVTPQDPALRARARAWERAADSAIDPILVDISYWMWAERPDAMPDGLLEKARADLDQFYTALEAELGDDGFLYGALSIADIALFPHLMSAKALQAPIDKQRFPKLASWLRRMLMTDIGRADVVRAREFVANVDDQDAERRKIFWRGDRIEWGRRNKKGLTIMKNKFLTMLALVFGAGALAGCGGESSSEDAAEVAEEAMDEAHDEMGKAMDAVEEVAEEASDAAEGAVEELEGAAEEIVDEVEEAVDEIAEEAEDPPSN